MSQNNTCQTFIVGMFVALFLMYSGHAGAFTDAGARDYFRYCASCHGISGRGDGPVADQLVKRPADLTVLRQKSDGLFPRNQVFFIIDGRGDVMAHGPRAMPVWGRIFGTNRPDGSQAVSTSQRIEAIIEYVEMLQER